MSSYPKCQMLQSTGRRSLFVFEFVLFPSETIPFFLHDKLRIILIEKSILKLPKYTTWVMPFDHEARDVFLSANYIILSCLTSTASEKLCFTNGIHCSLLRLVLLHVHGASAHRIHMPDKSFIVDTTWPYDLAEDSLEVDVQYVYTLFGPIC